MMALILVNRQPTYVTDVSKYLLYGKSWLKTNFQTSKGKSCQKVKVHK